MMIQTQNPSQSNKTVPTWQYKY